jgi:hypothetical protein
MVEKDMVTVADFLHRAVQITLKLQEEAGSRLLKDFVRVATEGDGEGKKQLEQLAKDVEAFSITFPLPGVPVRCSLTLLTPSHSMLARAGHVGDQAAARAGPDQRPRIEAALPSHLEIMCSLCTFNDHTTAMRCQAFIRPRQVQNPSRHAIPKYRHCHVCSAASARSTHCVDSSVWLGARMELSVAARRMPAWAMRRSITWSLRILP